MVPSGRRATTSVNVPPRSIQNCHLASPAATAGFIRPARPRTPGACRRVARFPTWSYRPTRCGDGTGPCRRGVPRLDCAEASRAVLLQYPQNAPRHPREKPHPDIEHRRQDLVAVVEAAKDEALLGQPGLDPGRRALGDPSPRIVCLVRPGKVDDALRVKRLVLFGENELVRDDIVDQVGSQGPWIAEISGLNRGWPVRKDAWPGMSRVTHQAHRDVHFQITYQPRCV